MKLQQKLKAADLNLNLVKDMYNDKAPEFVDNIIGKLIFSTGVCQGLESSSI